MSRLSYFFILTCFFSIEINAQSIEYHEVLNDPYMPMPRNKIKTSRAYSYINSSIVTKQVNTDSAGMNIVHDAANEPSIAIDRTDPTRMVIGWRQFDNIESDFRQAGIAYSVDAGLDWVNLPPIDAGNFRSDPVLSSDMNGKFFYNALGYDVGKFWCDVFMSTDLNDWSDNRYGFGGDKLWMDIDRTDLPSQGNIYANWSIDYTDCPNGDFSQSLDNGESWNPCQSVLDHPHLGTVSVGPDGELYLCGTHWNNFIVVKTNDTKDSESSLIWDNSVTVPLGGILAGRDIVNPAGLLGQVWIATDHSDSESRGNVYLLSTVKSSNDPADIKFSRSVDGGKTWSNSIRINKDGSGNYNWMGTMSVAPNGRIDVVWLDTRSGNPFQSALYYSFSTDTGKTWSKNEKLSETFDSTVGWPQQNKMGDYFHMISFDEGAHLAWSATFNGEQDVYYSFIQPQIETKTMDMNNDYGIQLLPNPVFDNFVINILSKGNEKLDLTIRDILGRTIFEKGMNVHQGKNSVKLSKFDCVNNQKGLFFLNISSENKVLKSCKIIFK